MGKADAQSLVDAVIERDLLWMAAEARQRGVAVIFSGYPTDKPANEPIHVAAGRGGVPFVDQQAAFDALLAGGSAFETLFLLDEHCTSAGYRQMAANLLPLVEDVRGSRSGG